MSTRLVYYLIALGLLSTEALAGTVELTGDDVTSAADIEAAIERATAGGTEPGIVILDGSVAPFEYTNGDRSININVSDLTLRGINSARIRNCGDGLFFDPVPVSDILIEGIVFNCSSNGIAWNGLGPRERVTVQDNVIQGDASGIVIGDSLDWNITRNIIISSLAIGVDLVGGADAKVINNLLIGLVGVRLEFDPVVVGLTSPTKHRIVKNRIEALEIGIRLDDAAFENLAAENRICLHPPAGPAIFLGPDTSDNRVRRNEAALVSDDGLVVVEDLGTDNKVSRNKQRRRC
jgi:hypothetical protein